MNRSQLGVTAVILFGGGIALWAILGTGIAPNEHSHGELADHPHDTQATRGAEHDDEGQHADEDETVRGPHGGRLLAADDGFAVEVTIYEPGIPPQSRVYPYVDGKPIDPNDVQLVVELRRFDRTDVLEYHKQGDFLLADKVVDEPHSFDVAVRASYRGKTATWSYSSYEGRVEIDPAAAASSGIVVEAAAPRRLTERLPVLGQVGFDQDAVRHVAARYAGVARALHKRIGDHVKEGDVLAIVQGNESLTDFEVRSSGSGQVVEKRVTVGEVVEAGEPLYVIAALGTVWVDFTIYRGDAPRVKAGQPVFAVPGDGLPPLEGRLVYLAPVGDAPSQSVTARAVVRNSTGELRPGMFVKGEIEVSVVDAAVAVRRDAIQTFRDWQVVFRNRNATYEIAIVELGLEDHEFVEVRAGLAPGERYVAANSFVVKAEIGKAGATHDH